MDILKVDSLQNVFDPYFTTKPSGHGLGQATVYSINDFFSRVKNIK